MEGPSCRFVRVGDDGWGVAETAGGMIGRVMMPLSKRICRRAFGVLASVIALLWLTGGAARAEQASALGVWYTESRESQVRLYACGAAICGNIVALKNPTKADGTPLLDTKNKDKALRGRPILGMQILGGFEPRGATRWTDGWGYDPDDGSTYPDVEMELVGPNELEVGGCILWGAICQMQTWERVAP